MTDGDHEIRVNPDLLLWACVEGEVDQLHAFLLAHVPAAQRMLIYETLCGSDGKLTAMPFKGETKCEVCERKRKALKIGVRGEPEVAVLGGPVLECKWTNGTWLAHFECRKREWICSRKTDDPTIRVMDYAAGVPVRTYHLLVEDRQREWWLEQPDVTAY